MKILIATSTITPNAGIPSFNKELCKLLESENIVDLLVNENITSYPGFNEVISISGVNPKSYSDNRKLLEIINRQNYDLIINSNSHIAAVLSPFINHATRIITISHSLGTMDCDNAIYNHKYIDRIVALSENCKHYILNRFNLNDLDKVSIVFNSVQSNKDADVIRQGKKEKKPISIVFPGGSAPSKSPDLVVSILKQLCKTDKDFIFYWLGNLTPPLKRFQSYKTIAEVLPNDPRIILKGRIPRNEATEIIASCNIFLAPSRREGFPMALLEAMSVGCIPIVSDFNIANKEVITNGRNGFVIPHKDINEFTNRIVDVIDNHSNYTFIYENSYNTFVNTLSFPIWRNKINHLISDVQSNHACRKEFTKIAFVKSYTGFKFLEKFNFLENHVKEVFPCAIKFWKFKH